MMLSWLRCDVSMEMVVWGEGYRKLMEPSLPPPPSKPQQHAGSLKRKVGEVGRPAAAPSILECQHFLSRKAHLPDLGKVKRAENQIQVLVSHTVPVSNFSGVC